MRRSFSFSFSLLCFTLPVFSWQAKVFQTQNDQVVVYSPQTSTVKIGSTLYFLSNGKVVAEGVVQSILHTNIKAKLKRGVTEKGQIVTDYKPTPAKKNDPSIVHDIDKKLIDAVNQGDLAGVQAAIRAGANVNVRGGALVSVASARNMAPIVKVLIEAGANVNYGDAEGLAPIHQAAGPGHLEIVKLLVQAKADVNVRDIGNSTALYWAAGADQKAVVEYLLQQNADLEPKSVEGFTASEWAAQNGHEGIVKMIQIEIARRAK